MGETDKGHSAQVWTLFDCRLNVYTDDHMGGRFDVARPSSTTLTRQLTTFRVFQSGLTNGGPAGLIYGFIFVWVGTALQTAVMAELASLYVFTSKSPKAC